MVRNATLEQINKKSVQYRTPDGEKTVDCDSVMIMLPERYDETFYESIKSLVPEVYQAGSTLGGENSFLKHAILDGREVGCKI